MSPEGKRVVVIGGRAKRHWERLADYFAASPEHVLVQTNSNDAKGSLEECRKLGSCVLIIDLESVSKVDPRVFARLVGQGRVIPVLVLVDHESKAQYESLLKRGCMGFLRLDFPAWQFRRAVDAVIAGELWAPRRFVSQMCRDLLSAFDPLKLTSREEEILALLAADRTNKEIADSLFISRETVRWHMRAIYRKLGIHDRSSALAYAQQRPSAPRNRRKRN